MSSISIFSCRTITKGAHLMMITFTLQMHKAEFEILHLNQRLVENTFSSTVCSLYTHCTLQRKQHGSWSNSWTKYHITAYLWDTNTQVDMEAQHVWRHIDDKNSKFRSLNAEHYLSCIGFTKGGIITQMISNKILNSSPVQTSNDLSLYKSGKVQDALIFCWHSTQTSS